MGSYSFAVPLSCRDPPRTPIGKSATACEFALRLVGGRQHVEQDFGLLQIEGFEPLGEPAVDRLFDSHISELQCGAVFDTAKGFEAKPHDLWTGLSIVGGPSS